MNILAINYTNLPLSAAKHTLLRPPLTPTIHYFPSWKHPQIIQLSNWIPIPTTTKAFKAILKGIADSGE